MILLIGTRPTSSAFHSFFAMLIGLVLLSLINIVIMDIFLSAFLAFIKMPIRHLWMFIEVGEWFNLSALHAFFFSHY